MCDVVLSSLLCEAYCMRFATNAHWMYAYTHRATDKSRMSNVTGREYYASTYNSKLYAELAKAFNIPKQWTGFTNLLWKNREEYYKFYKDRSIWRRVLMGSVRCAKLICYVAFVKSVIRFPRTKL